MIDTHFIGEGDEFKSFVQYLVIYICYNHLVIGKDNWFRWEHKRNLAHIA